MELTGFILIGLGATALVAVSLSGELSAFFTGYTPSVLGVIVVIAGLVLLFVGEVMQKNRLR
jgi:hypothetical protein